MAHTLLVALALLPLAQGTSDPVVRDLAPLLEPLRSAAELPALAAAVVEGADLVALGAVGRRRIDREDAVQATDLWHLGSCTKSMTATWVAVLVERGELEWDTALGDAFPELVEDDAMHPAWREVPLEWLLSNRSGMPNGLNADGLWSRLVRHEGTPVEQRRTLLEAVLARAPEAEPGTKYIYSNAGFSIGGAVAETALGESWEVRIRRDLFEPLGMDSAAFGAPGEPGRVTQPFGHRTRSEGLAPAELGPGDDNPSAIAPAGKVHCSLQDWAKYAALHLAGARGESDFLSAETFARLHTPQRGDYAMGWVARDQDWAGGPVLWHNGSNTMWYCEIAIVPEQNCAVLVASNRGDGDVRKAVRSALRAVYGAHIEARGR